MSKLDKIKANDKGNAEEAKSNLNEKMITQAINSIGVFKNLSNKEKGELLKAIENKDIRQLAIIIDAIKDTKTPEITEFKSFLEKDLLNHYFNIKPDLKKPEEIHEQAQFFKRSRGKFDILFVNWLSLINKKELYKKIQKKKPIKEYDEKTGEYKEVYENYTNFNNYVVEEFDLNKRTAYEWIDIDEKYHNDLIKLVRTSALIEYTKLAPSLPLLNDESISEDDKRAIKKDFISGLGKKTVTETRKLAKQYKEKYNIESKTPIKKKTSQEIESEVNDHMPKEQTDKQKEANKLFTENEISNLETKRVTKLDNTDDWIYFRKLFIRASPPTSNEGLSCLKTIYDGLKKFLETEGLI